MPTARATPAIVLFSGLLFASAAEAGALYQWRDAAGRLHVTDDATKVPPALRQRAVRKLAPLVPVQRSNDNAAPVRHLEGGRVWEEKCAACHHTGKGERDGKLGLGQLAIDPETRFLRRPEELLPRLKYATSGRTTDMPEVEISDEELLAVARYLVAAQGGG